MKRTMLWNACVLKLYTHTHSLYRKLHWLWEIVFRIQTNVGDVPENGRERTICVETLELQMPSRHGVSMWTCEDLSTFYAMPMKFLLFSQNLSILCTVGFRPHKFHFQLKHTKDFTHSTPLKLRQMLSPEGENGKVKGEEAGGGGGSNGGGDYVKVEKNAGSALVVGYNFACIAYVWERWRYMRCNAIPYPIKHVPVSKVYRFWHQ